MKKIISLLVVLTLMAAFLVTSVFAAEATQIVVEEAVGVPGEQVTVKVSIANNAGIGVGKFDVSYDEAALELESIDVKGGILENIQGMTMGTADGKSLRFACSTLDNITENGTLFTLTFNVKAEATEGSYDVNVNVDYLRDTNADPVDFTITAGAVVIAHEHNMVHYEAVAGNCYEPGMLEHWYCEGCDCYFTDAEGKYNIAYKSLYTNVEHEVVYMEAIEAGCHSQGNIEYWYCTECETVWQDEDLTQITNHKNVIIAALGSENVEHFAAVDATCHGQGIVEHWYCPDCDTLYADEACTIVTNKLSIYLPAIGSENVVHVPAKAPTATENGNVEFWYCRDCDSYFLDAACTQVTNIKNIVIPATGEVVEDCEHNLIHMEAVEPGCHYDGNIEHWYCTECETVWQDEELTQITNHKNVIIPALGGEVTHFEAVKAGCHSLGNVEYWYCDECEQFWADEALTQITNSKNVILPATGSENVEHFAAVDATCHGQGIVEHWYCPDCDTLYADEACTIVTNNLSVYLPAIGSENVVHVEAKAPTATENGNVEYWYCPDCDGYFLDAECTQLTNALSVILPATGEAIEDCEHNIVHMEAVEPGCHYDGHIEHWYCTKCETVWQDEALTQITNHKNVIIPALGGEVIHFEAVEPGCHSNGNIEYWFCAECEQFWADEALTQLTNSKNVIVPALGENVIHFEAVEPGCHYNGNIEYWTCTECEGFWADEALTQVTNSKNVIIPALGGEVIHFEAVEPGCHYNGNIEYWFCAECEQFWADEALTQLTNSKNVIVPALGENVIHFEAVAPGCHYDGNIEYWTCVECEQVWQDEALTQLTNRKNVIIPALGGEVIHFEAVTPGCHDNGNIEYWFCAECEQFWADEALTQLTNSKSVILPATGSENVVHVEAKAPTATENGNVEYWYCPDCDRYFLDAACTQITNAKNVIIPATSSVPETGDSIMTFVMIATVSTMALAGVVALNKKKFF